MQLRWYTNPKSGGVNRPKQRLHDVSLRKSPSITKLKRGFEKFTESVLTAECLVRTGRNDLLTPLADRRAFVNKWAPGNCSSSARVREGPTAITLKSPV